MSVTGRLLTGALAERTGLPADSFELRVCTGALLGAMAEAMFLWAEGGSEQDMIGTVDRALRLLESGLNSAMSAPAPRDRRSARRK
jgi:hypothetical protein